MEPDYIEQFIVSSTQEGHEVDLPLGKDVTIESNGEIALQSASFIYNKTVEFTEEDFFTFHGNVWNGDIDVVQFPSAAPLSYDSLLRELTDRMNRIGNIERTMVAAELKAYVDSSGRIHITMAYCAGSFPQFHLRNASADTDTNSVHFDTIDADSGTFTGSAETYGYLSRASCECQIRVPQLEPQASLSLYLVDTLTGGSFLGVHILMGQYYISFQDTDGDADRFEPVPLATPSVDDTIRIGKSGAELTVNLYDVNGDILYESGFTQVTGHLQKLPLDAGNRTFKVLLQCSNSTAPVEVTGIKCTMSPYISSSLDGYSTISEHTPPTHANITTDLKADVFGLSFGSTATANKLGFSSAELRFQTGIKFDVVADYPIGHYTTPATINLGLRTPQLQLNSKDNLIVAVPITSVTSDRVSFQASFVQWLPFRMSVPWKINALELFAVDDKGKPITLKNVTVNLLVKTPVHPGRQGPLATQYAKLARLGGREAPKSGEERDAALIQAIKELTMSIPRSIKAAMRPEEEDSEEETEEEEEESENQTRIVPNSRQHPTLLPSSNHTTRTNAQPVVAMRPSSYMSDVLPRRLPGSSRF